MPQIEITQDQSSDWVRAVYGWAGTGLDRAMPAHMASGPFEISGMDFREIGSLLRFPGFLPTTIGSVPIAGDPAPKFLRRINLNKGSSGHEVRGWVILRRHVIFAYWDTELRAMFAKILRYNFGGLQLNSDSFSCASSGKALYMSFCGETTGGGLAAAGQRTLRVDSGDFFRPGDTIMIERDTAAAEEAIVDSYTGTTYRTPDGRGGWITAWQVQLRSNLLRDHGPAKYAVEGGSGKVGMTVVTHDGTDFLIEQAGPLHEDGELEFDVDVIGGTTEAPTTTTVDVACNAPKINSPIRAGDAALGGSISGDDPAGPDGVDVECQYDSGSGFASFHSAGQSLSFKTAADGTWTRAVGAATVAAGRRFRCRIRLPDVGDGNPGPWAYSAEVTAVAAAPAAKSSLAELDPVYAGSFRMTGRLGSAATATAKGQVVVQSGNAWVAMAGTSQQVGIGEFAINMPNDGVPFEKGKSYSFRSKDSADAEWSGDLDGADGRLASIAVTCLDQWSTLTSIIQPVTQGDSTVRGTLTGGKGVLSEGQVVEWKASLGKWVPLSIVYPLGQHGPYSWELPLSSTAYAGDLVSVRTRITSSTPWSGSLDGDDGRLRSIAVEVQ